MSARNSSKGPELPSKTKRTSKPKVRTGCKTCKIRRVKCDETKPYCLRCIKYWGACDGYPDEEPKPSKQRVVDQVRSNSIAPQPQLGPQFDNVQEQRFYQIYREDTSVTLGGLLDGYIWNELILQACEQEPFVRDAVVAVGAITKSRRDFEKDRQADVHLNNRCCLSSSPAFEYALQLYGKAIKGMRQAHLNGDYGLRMSLIACLLVVCFEGIYGTPLLALTHAEQGIKLLSEWMSLRGVSTQAVLNSPAPNIIEDDLIHVFNRLDVQILTFSDLKPAEINLRQEFNSEEEDVIKHMPSTFTSLQQARVYWDLVMRRCCHFLATAFLKPKSEPESFWSLAENHVGGDLVDVAAELHDVSAHAAFLKVQHERDRCIEDVVRWDLAFSPTFQAFESTGQKWALGFLGASCLKICSITTKILLAGAFFDSEAGYDLLLPDFKETLTLAEPLYKYLIALRAGKASFHFDPMILPALFVIIIRCRDRITRRRAIALLESHGHREGTWDSIALARAGEWIMALEEEGVETTEIPDHRRARLTKLNIDLEQRRAQICIFQRAYPSDPNAIFKETTLTW